MDWTHGCGWGRARGIADCRYAGGQLMRSTAWRPGLDGYTVAHDCRWDAEIAVLQTAETDCMAYCSADQSADVVTAQVTVSAY